MDLESKEELGAKRPALFLPGWNEAGALSQPET